MKQPVPVIAALLAGLAWAGAAHADPAADRATLESALLAAFPAPDRRAPAPDAQEAERLTALNPGRADAILPLLARKAACESDAIRSIAARALADVVHGLPEESLRKLTAFDTGPDFARFDALVAEAASDPAKRAELEALVTAYGLQDFSDAMQTHTMALWSDPATLAPIDICAGDLRDAFAQANLRME